MGQAPRQTVLMLMQVLLSMLAVILARKLKFNGLVE
jgi:hypothetical protein